MGREMRACLLSSAYLAPVEYYTKLYAYEEVWVEAHEHYVKQTWRNRCLIASPGGVQALTIPVVAPGGRTAMKDVRVSDHGNWRHLHWHALETAYMNSPFFEFYADDFRPFYEQKWEFLFDFNEALRETVCGLIGLETPVATTGGYGTAGGRACVADDWRGRIGPKAGAGADASFRPQPYYQVFARRHGFLPNLSIADLLFNMGPEALVVLRDSVAITNS